MIYPRLYSLIKLHKDYPIRRVVSYLTTELAVFLNISLVSSTLVVTSTLNADTTIHTAHQRRLKTYINQLE